MTDASAPYRFIPLEPKLPVQLPPVARNDISFDKPLEGCSISGVLKVEWTAMTPVCIGDAPEDATEVAPLKVGERYCLSGTSLRGMLRSVMETLTFSHLGRINSHHHHSERDFAGMGAHSENHSVKPAALKAGWLRWSAEDGQWRLYPGRNPQPPKGPAGGRPGGNQNKFVLAPIDEILAKLPKEHSPAKSVWQGSMSVAAKYAKLQAANVSLRVDTVFPLRGAESPANHEVMRVALRSESAGGLAGKLDQNYPARNLYYVFTGKYQQEAAGGATSKSTGKAKQNEPLFPEPSSEGCVVPAKWMNIFHRMHSNVTNKGINPKGDNTWWQWLRAFSYEEAFGPCDLSEATEAVPANMGKLPGIPVFWKGELDELKTVDADKTAIGDQSFWFSLSRVMRIPHSYSVGEVGQRLYSKDPKQRYRVPKLEQRNGWDFTKALFGWVDQESWFEKLDAPQSAKGAKAASRADGTDAEDAQRGRVATGFAWATGNVRPDQKTINGVFSNPRESFWPFYLRHMDAKPDPSGYSDLTASYSSDKAIPAGRKRTVVRRQAVEPPRPTSDNDKVRTTVRFLPAGTTFVGEIRFHNLHPVEFGALLFTLTFGETDGSLWHQVGRAKGFGYGALKPRVSRARPLRIIGPLPENCDPALADFDSWMSLFEEWMDERLEERMLAPFKRHATIRMLLAAADPKAGSSLAAQLVPMELPSFKDVKDKCGPARDGAATSRYPLKNP